MDILMLTFHIMIGITTIAIKLIQWILGTQLYEISLNLVV